MSSSGWGKQITDFQKVTVYGLEQAAVTNSADSLNIKSEIELTFQQDRINELLFQQLKVILSEEEATSLLGWYQSDLGKLITQQEFNASTAESYQKMMESESVLTKEGHRKILSQQIISASMEFQKVSKIQVNTFLTISTAAAVVTDNKKFDQAEKRKAFSEHMIQREDAFNGMLVLISLFSLKDVNESDIEKYLAFLQNSEYQKFNTSVLNEMIVALDKLIIVMKQNLTEFYTKKKSEES